jgi:hypothetical protein
VNGVFRGVNWFMCALFLLAVVVQWNDPDPLQWMAIYGAALAVCVAVAMRRPVPIAVPLLITAVALVWGVITMGGVPNAGTYTHMFDAWEMKSSSVEEAREASGLLIVVAWMLVTVVAQRRGAGKKS